MDEALHSFIEQLKMMHNIQWGIVQNHKLEFRTTLRGLVLNLGIGKFSDGWIPQGISQGEVKQCFANATELMLLNNNRFIYTEGYAIRRNLGIVVGEHAWVLDKDNNYSVVDNTWENPEDSIYLGIPFQEQFVIEAAVKRGYYGLLDDWQNQWPLAREPDNSKFLHPDYDKIPRDFEVPDGRDT